MVFISACNVNMLHMKNVLILINYCNISTKRNKKRKGKKQRNKIRKRKRIKRKIRDDKKSSKNNN